MGTLKPGYFWVKITASFAKLAWNDDTPQEWQPAHLDDSGTWWFIGSDDVLRPEHFDIGDAITAPQTLENNGQFDDMEFSDEQD